MEKYVWGQTPNGEDLIVYELTGEHGMKASVMNYGANLLSLFVPDKNGDTKDVVLGYEHFEDYFTNDAFFGCSVVPCGNRIGDARFTLNGKTYELDKNDGINNLHSGFNPLCRRIWDVDSVSENSITFSYQKKDMDMGFPGNATYTVTYTLTPEMELRIDYTGLSDADTIFNPTNHSYFNLAGHDAGDSAMDQLVWINASRFTQTDPASIPDGVLLDVAGTPMDFTTPKPMAPEIDDAYSFLAWASGYDHNFVLDKPLGETGIAASFYDPASGRKMEVYTDLPGMQLYAGNYINNGLIGKGGCTYGKRHGVAFETQYFPNAINIPSFPQPIQKAGELTKTTTTYKFTTVL